MRRRRSDADLLDAARAGSAAAFAALLHRHRDVIERSTQHTPDPEHAARAIIVDAMRGLPSAGATAPGTDGGTEAAVDGAPELDVRTWLASIAARRAPSGTSEQDGRPGTERPQDGWFDHAWVRTERRWPTGRRPLRVPRRVAAALGVVALAGLSSAVTVATLTAQPFTEVLSELVAEPVDDPSELVVPGPVEELEPEEVPELFDDIELGELPTYDLGGSGGSSAPGPSAPAPPAPSPPSEDPADADEDGTPGNGDGDAGDGDAGDDGSEPGEPDGDGSTGDGDPAEGDEPDAPTGDGDGASDDGAGDGGGDGAGEAPGGPADGAGSTDD